jgi:uncharacterized protein (DUF433 family)
MLLMGTQYSRINMGVYTLQEAALYGCLSPHKLSRWVFGTSTEEAVIRSPFAQDHLVSFYDLVQAMAVNSARALPISLPKIREAVARARKNYSVDCPLAYRHMLYFDSELLIDLPNKGGLIQLTGRGHDQSMMRTIIEPFMQHLCFAGDGLVTQYVAFTRNGRNIVLDPRRQFGQPLVGDKGVRADALASAYHAEQSFELVAYMYQVDVEDVQTAVEYIRSLRPLKEAA